MSNNNSKLNNPFVGLRAFEENEDYLFFGRNKPIEELSNKLIGNRFLAVIGSSGSGKSSLVKSGLLPNIFSGFFSVGSNWRVALMRPGENPLGYLTDALADKGSLYSKNENQNDPFFKPTIEATLRRSENGLVQVYKEALGLVHDNQQFDSNVESAPKKKPDSLLIVVDQFEEIFRFRKYEKESKLGRSDSQQFIKILLTAAQQSEFPIYVMLTMRSDFLGDCSEFNGLPEAINQGQYLVPRMTREEIRDCITEPVAISGAVIAPRLVTRLLNDVGNNPDQLPILQHAMMRTWDAWYKRNQNDAPIDFEDYDKIGTMKDALSNHANEAYDELKTEKDKKTCELIFKALTDKAADARGTRRPSRITDLSQLADATTEELKNIVEIFRKPGRTFLMPPPGIEITEQTIIDISHESLIRQWGRLSKWVDEETESAKTYLRLSEAATLNKEGKKDLIAGTELQIGLDWRTSHNPNATWAGRYNDTYEETIQFLENSKTKFETDKKEKEEQQKKQLKRTRIFASVISVIGVIAIAATIYAFFSKATAERFANDALSYSIMWKSKNALDNDPTLALRLAQYADSINNHDSTLWQEALRIYRENSFYKIVARDSFPIISVAFSPDGKNILTGSEDSTARLWDLMGNKIQEFNGHSGGISSVAFSPDGKTILTGSGDSTARLWDLKGNTIQEFNGHSERITSVAFSPDGKTILTGSNDCKALLWDLKGNTMQEFKGHSSLIASVAFSPDGKTILTGSFDKTARLWDLKGNQIQEFNGHSSAIKSVAFSPNGKNILTGSYDQTARLWDLKGNTIQEFKGHSSWILCVTFSPNGKNILTGSGDQTVRLWDLKGNTIKEFKGHSSAIKSVAFSPDGKTILTGSTDSTKRLWDLKGNTIQEFIGHGHSDPISSVAFSPDGKNILTGSWDQTARLCDLKGDTIQEFKGLSGHITSVAFSPDGKTILTRSGDKTARLWDLKGDTIQEFKGHSDWITSVAFSPDGKNILTGSMDSTARLWDLKGNTIQEFKGHSGAIHSVAFSPDGKNILTGSWDQTARLWDLKGNKIQEFKGHSDGITSIAFSPGGKTILTGSYDQTARMWDLKGNTIQEFKGHSDAISSVAFSPDGKTILTGSYDNTARLWEVPMSLKDFLKKGNVEPLTAAQKKEYGIK
ncbi:MAG: WD40 repeat domain-containing protein [Bacteroidia bacterium]